MSFETIERLKREYTDKWVHVDPGTPELRRFAGLNGKIKTVNMNGRALVQFDGPVDISWYDIDLAFLKVIDAPVPKPAVEEKHAAPAEKKPAPAAKPTGGKSPLELAREQAAKAAAGGAAPAKKSPIELAREQGAAKAAGAAKKSPLELAREQGAAKAKAAATEAAPAPEAAAPVEPAPAPAAETPTAAPLPTTGPDGRPLSKIELARRQGAFKGKQ